MGEIIFNRGGGGDPALPVSSIKTGNTSNAIDFSSTAYVSLAADIDTEQHNQGDVGYQFTSSNGVVTVPVTGTYLVYLNVRLQTTVVTKDMQVNVGVNGLTPGGIGATVRAAIAYDKGINYYALLSLSAGDTIEPIGREWDGVSSGSCFIYAASGVAEMSVQLIYPSTPAVGFGPSPSAIKLTNTSNAVNFSNTGNVSFAADVDSEVLNVGDAGLQFSSSSGVITVPVTGFYHVILSIDFTNTTATKTFTFNAGKNGGTETFEGMERTLGTAVKGSDGFETIILLNAGDTIEPIVKASGTSGSSGLTAATDSCEFSAILLREL